MFGVGDFGEIGETRSFAGSCGLEDAAEALEGVAGADEVTPTEMTLNSAVPAAVSLSNDAAEPRGETGRFFFFPFRPDIPALVALQDQQSRCLSPVESWWQESPSGGVVWIALHQVAEVNQAIGRINGGGVGLCGEQPKSGVVHASRTSWCHYPDSRKLAVTSCCCRLPTVPWVLRFFLCKKQISDGFDKGVKIHREW